VPSVTFDTNSLESVLSPATAQREEGAAAEVVRDAIANARISGFFSETLVTLEAIEGKKRAGTLGQTRIVSQSAETGKNQIQLTIGVKHFREPLNARFQERMRRIGRLGLLALYAPKRIGGYHQNGMRFYEPVGEMAALLAAMDRVHSLATAISKRGFGMAVPIELGTAFTRRAKAPPELFVQGLGRAASGAPNLGRVLFLPAHKPLTVTKS
jgi:hypothetical protein